MKFSALQRSFDAPSIAVLPRLAAKPITLSDLIETFVLSKEINACSEATIRTYRFWLERLRLHVSDKISALDNGAIARFIASPRERGLTQSTIHQAYRCVKAFTRWLVATGALEHNPMDGVCVRTPMPLPQVPTEEEVRAVLEVCCRDTFEGTRNVAAILTMIDSGLRVSELVHAMVQDWNPHECSLLIRRGKGGKPRATFVGPTTMRTIQEYLAMRPQVSSGDFLFADVRNRPLKARNVVQILHRLSARAGLPLDRRLHPHGLRHFAATSWLRHGIGLDQVRRLLGHSSIQMTLRYSSLVAADLQQAHRTASVVERLLERSNRPNMRGGARVLGFR